MMETRLRFIASYPESGGHCAGALLAAYLDGGGNEEVPQLPSDADAAPYHQASPLPPRNLGFGAQVQTRSAALLGLARSADSSPVATTHNAAVVHEGLSLFSTVFTEKVAVVVRDPRDVAVSLSERLEVPAEEAVEFMADRERVLAHDNHLAHAVSSWSTHVATWLQYDAVPTRFFRYEDLLAETEEEVTKMLGFLDVEEAVDRDRVREAVELASPDAVRRQHRSLAAEGAVPEHRRVCRRASVGIWRDVLDERLLRGIEEEHGELMRAAGYKPLLAAGGDSAEAAAGSKSQPDLDAEALDTRAAETGLGSQATTDRAAAAS